MENNNKWNPTYKTKDDVKELEKNIIFEGKSLQFTEFKVKFKTYSGKWSNITSRYILTKKHAAAILLFNPYEDYIVLVEQFRIGALHAGKSSWILEPVAGLIEPNDTPETTAIREAKEEANCEAKKLIYICNYLASPGTTNELTSVYCGLIQDSQEGIYGLSEENEDIKVHKIPTERAFKMLTTGEIFSAAAIISIQWLQLNYDNLTSSPT